VRRQQSQQGSAPKEIWEKAFKARIEGISVVVRLGIKEELQESRGIFNEYPNAPARSQKRRLTCKGARSRLVFRATYSSVGLERVNCVGARAQSIPGTRNGRDSRSGEKRNELRRLQQRQAQRKEINCSKGAKAYAPFGAGRETGHQVPAVAAKIEGENARCRRRIANETMRKEERRRKGKTESGRGGRSRRSVSPWSAAEWSGAVGACAWPGWPYETVSDRI
jgi:hypothetical protein